MYQIWRIYLDLWGYDCKKWVWPTFGCKLGQSDPIVMQLELHMSCHLLNVYTKFQIDISKHVEEKPGKRGQTDGRTDGQTDRRTDGHCHGIIRPFFKHDSKYLHFVLRSHQRNYQSFVNFWREPVSMGRGLMAFDHYAALFIKHAYHLITCQCRLNFFWHIWLQSIGNLNHFNNCHYKSQGFFYFVHSHYIYMIFKSLLSGDVTVHRWS